MGKNPGRNRNHNRRVLLELLRRNGPMGRKAMADLAQISTQAVGNIIEDLMAEGLLRDLGRLRSGRGLPPIQYALNPDGAITLGFEIAVSELTVTVLDIGGNLRHEEHVPLPDMAPGPVLSMVAESVARLRADYPGQLMGIGVVMPGPFGIEGMSGVGPTTLHGWTETSVAQDLAQRCGVPVYVDNDANAAAVGELLFGKGQNVSHFCQIYFGAGTGLGAIVDDQPLRGAFGNAGEIGHIIVAPVDAAPGSAGPAPLERFASLYSLREMLEAAGQPASLEDLRRHHRDGSPVLDAWLSTAAPYLSAMIGILENIFDPQTVIIGGKLPGAVLDALVERLAIPSTVANRTGERLPRVQRGQTGQASAALGAAALPFFNAITPRLDRAEDGLAPMPD